MFPVNVDFSPKYSSSVNKKSYAYPHNSKHVRNNVNFTGCFFSFKTPVKLDVEVLDGVSSDFLHKVQESIQMFPAYWLKQLKKYDYKAVLSNSWADAYKKKGVEIPFFIEKQEKYNFWGALGLTNTEGLGGKNFFVFCDKPPLSKQYTQNIVNHELSHGVVDIAQLDENKSILDILKKDIANAKKEGKLEKLSLDEKQMVSNFFFGKDAQEPETEIIADCFAWAHGKGCYGTKVAINTETDNPELMPTLFPELTKYLKKV